MKKPAEVYQLFRPDGAGTGDGCDETRVTLAVYLRCYTQLAAMDRGAARRVSRTAHRLHCDTLASDAQDLTEKLYAGVRERMRVHA